MPPKRPSKSSSDVQAALRDAEGIVELTNMQLRLATALRRKLEGLADVRPARRKKGPKR